MSAILVQETYEGLVENQSRSFIVGSDTIKEGIEDVNEELVTVFQIDLDTYLVTLTQEGVLHVLNEAGVSYEGSLDILKDIEVTEKMQISSLLDYLRLEKHLGNKVVYIMLKDARVRTNESVFKQTYCLPLDTVLHVLEETGYHLISKSTTEKIDFEEELDYKDIIFINKQYDKIVSLFINVEG